MELRHIRYFIAVAEELHFGRAAEKLGIAQPPLSQQIKQLEDELGGKLFHRTSRKVELTDAGTAFLRRARAIINQSHEMLDTVRSIAKGESGKLTVGFNEVAIDSILPDVIMTIRRDYPDIDLSLREMRTVKQLDALRRYIIDAGVMQLFLQDLSGLRSSLLCREKYVVAMHRGHRLAAEKTVHLSTLRDENQIIFPAAIHPAFYEDLMQCFEKVGGRPRIIQEAATRHARLSLVATGLGVAVVPESSINSASRNITFRPIVGEMPKIEHFLVWRDEPESSKLLVFQKLLGIR